jgi:PAS domain S-box-containing protein
MKEQPFDDVSEIKRLQRCMSDLVSVLALSAVWSRQDPGQIAASFCDAIAAMLDLDFLYVRTGLEAGEESIEALKLAPSNEIVRESDEIRRMLLQEFKADPRKWPAETRSHFTGKEISLLSVRLGLDGENGVVVAGSRRAKFPQETESLLLSVAANQMAVGLQQALLLSEQKKIAKELDRRVADRTRELAETNEELQLQVEQLRHLPVAAWTLKPDGKLDFVNQAWLEYSGQTLDSARSNPEAWMTAVHPDDREVALNGFWRGVHTGQGFEMETRFRRARDGIYRWHLNRAVALRDAEGRVLRFVGTSTDIDNRKLAEEELRASEAKLLRVIDTIPSLSWCNLPDGPNEFLSKGWHDYTGMSPEEAHGWGWSSAFHQDDLPPLMKRWQELLISGESGEIEARIRRHDGEYRWFLIRVAPFRDESGAIFRWYGTSTDIHDRKLADEALRASEAQLRLIIDSTPGFLGVLGPTGEVEFVSRQNSDYFGLTPEDLKGWKTIDVVHPDDLPRAIVKFTNSLTTGTPFFDEHRYRRADGEYRWFDVRIYPARDTQGRITRWFTFSIDVHDRKLAEEALRASETNLRQTVNSIPGLICTMNPAGEIEELNQPLLEYFGKTPEELKGWRMTDAVHPDDLPEVIEAYTYSVTTGTPYAIEHRCRRADGVYRWFQVRALAVRDADGHITGWYVLLTDIDDRKRTEDELKRSEARHRVVIETASDAVVSIDESGTIILANPATKRIFGYTPEAIVGKPLTVLMPGAMRKLHQTGFKRYLETGARHLNWQGTEVTALRANGEEFPAEVSFGEMVTDQGKVFTGLIRDISEKKRAQEAILASERNLSLIINTMPVLAWSALPDGSVEFFNQRWLDYTGLSPEHAQGWGWAEAVHRDDLSRLTQYWQSILTTGGSGEIEARFRRFDGDYRWFLLRANPLRDESGAIIKWYGTNTDINDRKRAEDALNELRSELAHMARVSSLGALTASIAHEVNQPLSGIVTNAGTCLRTLSADPPHIQGAREAAQRMIRDGKRASEVITRLRALFSKKRAMAESLDLNEAARDVIALCVDELQRNRVILRQEFADGLPPVTGDRVQLQQVILNLLRNALDAMSGVDERPRELAIKTERDEGGVRLTVRDTGVGITPQDMERLFEAFYTTKSGGMGMGLSISHTIIQSHNGRLWATPNDGPGATFSFSIPCNTGHVTHYLNQGAN